MAGGGDWEGGEQGQVVGGQRRVRGRFRVEEERGAEREVRQKGWRRGQGILGVFEGFKVRRGFVGERGEFGWVRWASRRGFSRGFRVGVVEGRGGGQQVRGKRKGKEGWRRGWGLQDSSKVVFFLSWVVNRESDFGVVFCFCFFRFQDQVILERE